MYPTYPDSPEAVALSLLEKILEREDQSRSNEPPAAHTLNRYAQCLQAVRGHRETPVLQLVQ
jgi:hypothetical protein